MAESGRRHSCCCERHRIIRNNEPALRRSVHAGRSEVGHLPVADLGDLKIVQGQLAAYPAMFGVDDDLQ